MNVLFLSLFHFRSIHDSGIYPDLLREFVKNGHRVHILSPVETMEGEGERDIEVDGVRIVKVKTGRIQQTNVIEKGINTILIERRFVNAIRKHFRDVRFDLVLYPTPPITLVNAVEYVKRRDGAKSYLMLKDIFPQNAVDIGVLRKEGLSGWMYKYFRRKEKRLYAVSDCIGCMSPANAAYLVAHNPEVARERVEVCPNSIEARDMSLTREEKLEIRKRYDLPGDKKIFVYGGNLGRPQGIPFLIECLKSQIGNPEAFFLIVGSGTDYGKLKTFFEAEAPENMRLMRNLPREEYDRMVAACDVGMIFLDHRFTIPNFPSRLLSYMQAKLPVLACTDPNTDIGKVIVDGGFGWWCESDDVESFSQRIKQIEATNLESMGQNGHRYILEQYSVQGNYRTILRHFE